MQDDDDNDDKNSRESHRRDSVRGSVNYSSLIEANSVSYACLQGSSFIKVYTHALISLAFAVQTAFRLSTTNQSTRMSMAFSSNAGVLDLLNEDAFKGASNNDDTENAAAVEKDSAFATAAPEAKPNQTGRAIVLLLLAGLTASLQGAAIQLCAPLGFQWTALLLQTSAIGLLFSVGVMKAADIPYLADASNARSMAKRGALGGAANVCAFLAISSLDLGVANCLMFTMPLWTAVLAYFKLGQPWGYPNILLAVMCLGGVVLVSELWDSFDHRASLVGIAAGLSFAVVNADAVLVTNTELRGEHPLSMTVAIMAAGVLLGGAAVLVQELAYHESTYTFSAGLEPQLLAVSVSFGLPLMLVFRNAGFACSKDTSVAQVLYLEVVMSFGWQALLLKSPPNATQVAGAAVIIVGSVAAMVLKTRLQKPAAASSSSSSSNNNNNKSLKEALLASDD
jgi:drug/metabolite transporter (DMT)-like permease